MNDIKPWISFVIYISPKHNINYVETLLTSIVYLNKKDEYQVIIVNSNDSEELLSVINKYSNELNLVYFKISSDLGQSYAFNLAIPHIDGIYCHFIGHNLIIQQNYLNIIRKTNQFNDNKADIMLLYDEKTQNTVQLEKLAYEKVDKELILSLNPKLEYYIFNSEFIKDSNVSFQDFVYQPLVFIISLISIAKILVYIPIKIIEQRFKPISTYNVYDILYQVNDCINILEESNIYNETKFEWNTFLAKNIYCDFLELLINSYDINVKYKINNKHDILVIKAAIQSIKNLVSTLGLNVDKSPFIPNDKNDTFSLYNQIIKSIR